MTSETDFQLAKSLNFAEIFYDSGAIKLRYTRMLSEDGSRWIREGLFESYYESGQLSSRGQYHNGQEIGKWVSYHKNGQKAAEGQYKNGEEIGTWSYWDEDGIESD